MIPVLSQNIAIKSKLLLKKLSKIFKSKQSIFTFVYDLSIIVIIFIVIKIKIIISIQRYLKN